MNDKIYAHSLEAVIDRAVQAERKRCADIVRGYKAPRNFGHDGILETAAAAIEAMEAGR